MKQDERILESAAEWFDRLRHEQLSAEQLASWQRWMEDAEHQKAFDRLQDAWQRFEGVPLPPLASATDRMNDCYTGDVSIAAWISGRRPGSRIQLFRRPIGLAAAFALVGLCGVAVWYYSRHFGPNEVAAFETRTGEHREVRLADGTALSIGAKSLVWVRFQPASREVVLDRGEAFFRIAKDSRRPFVVRAGNASITAIGTAFNVRKSGARVQVVVAEGVVSVKQEVASPVASPKEGSKFQGTQLRAGHQWSGDPTAHRPNVSRTSPDSAIAWRTGRLEYRAEPLQYVVADVNRYSSMNISIADPKLGELPVTGTVFGEDIEGWLKSIEEFIPVRVERASKEQVVLHSRNGEQRRASR